MSTLHITLQNTTFSTVIADKLAFSITSPDRASALLTVPHEFVPGLYGEKFLCFFCIHRLVQLTVIRDTDLVVEEVVGDSIIYTGEVNDLELLSQSSA